jgi:cysteine-rich repeat protein
MKAMSTSRFSCLLGLAALLAACGEAGPQPTDGSVLPVPDGGPPRMECVTTCSRELRACLEDGTTLRVCEDDGFGCIRETLTSCDDTENGFCAPNAMGAMQAACIIDACRSVPDACAEEGRVCRGGVLIDCAANTDGCLVETRTTCADLGGFCDSSGEVPFCNLPADPCADLPDACSTEGVSCDGDVFVDCAPDAFGCLRETRVDCTEEGSGCGESATTAFCFGGPPCLAECESAGATCDGPELITCAPDPFLCLEERRRDCTEVENGFCDGGSVNRDASCRVALRDPCLNVEECETLGRVCEADTLVVCARDASGCQIEERTDCALGLQICDPGTDLRPTACIDTSCEPARTYLDCTSGTVSLDTAAGVPFFGANACNEGASYLGPEAAIQFTPATDARVTFTVTAAAGAAEHDLVVLESNPVDTCSEVSPCLASDLAPGADATVTVDLAGGQLAYVLYDQLAAVATPTGTPFDLTVSCETPVCGDGVLGAFEVCDDGNRALGDGCAADCRSIEPDFECVTEPGMPTVCDLICSNGRVDEGEQCDDGNVLAEDGCDPLCQVELDWECDDGEPTVCNLICSNGRIDEFESCDDGNLVIGDGCSTACQVEPRFTCVGEPSVCTETCGDGTVLASEGCDDGNIVGGDGCSSFCTVERDFVCTGSPSVCTRACGNGTVELTERCDDGNFVDGDGCDALCDIEPGWECSGAPSSCNLICSNGLLDDGEDCDDGNATNADGCSSECIVERLYTCGATAPSVCTLSTPALCGNATVDDLETCDDGNTVTGDGCSADCAEELPNATGTLTLTGSIDAADPDFQRPNQDCSARVSTGHNYDVFYVHNPFADTIDFRVAVAFPGGDGYLHIYDERFDGASPTVGCLSGDDDYNGTAASRDIMRVPPGVTRAIVISTFSAGATVGAYTITITQSCGNSEIDDTFDFAFPETCDDGNAVTDDGCDATCQREPGYECTGEPSVCTFVCGNSRLDTAAGEDCDDGNLLGGDGCDDLCQIEFGYVCTGTPSVCTLACGNGTVDVGADEQCDDSNTVPADGCSATCQVETGFQCRGAPVSCTARTCGNSVVDTSESCDDGNTVSGDGCFDCGDEIASTGSITLTGSIDASDPDWSRPGATCSAGSGSHNFDEFRITNQTGVAQDLRIDATWAADGYLHVMRDWYNPDDPVAGCVIGDDDFGGTLASRIDSVRIGAGETLYVVASTFSAGTAIGAYTITVTTL